MENNKEIAPLLPNSLIEFKKSLGIYPKKCPVILIIDKISMVTATMLAIISARLIQATGIDTKFGGIPVFMFGDFAQINPVRGKSLPDAVMEKMKIKADNKNGNSYPLSNKSRGIDLLLAATWFPLKQQVRCAEDEKHLKFVEKLGAGEIITLGDMQNYDILSKEDMKKDKWAFSPILVPNNRERIDITEQQSIKFAKKHNTCVIRWPVSIKANSWKGKPNNFDEIKKKDPCFWQYFVRGATGYVLTNVNVNAYIANGTECKCHSLTLPSKKKQNG